MTKKRSSSKTSRREKEPLATWLTGGSEESANEQGYKTAYITLRDIPQSKIPTEGSEYEYSCNSREETKIKTTGTVIASKIPTEVEAVSFENTDAFSKVRLPEKKPDTTTVYFAKLLQSNEYIFRIDTDESKKVYVLDNNTCGVEIKYGTTKLEIKQFDWTPNTAAENSAEDAESEQLRAKNLESGRQLLVAEEEIEDMNKKEENRKEEANARINADKKKTKAEAEARKQANETKRHTNEARKAEEEQKQKEAYAQLQKQIEERQVANAAKTAARQKKEEKQILAAEDADKEAQNAPNAKKAKNAANAEKAEQEKIEKEKAEKLAALKAARNKKLVENLANNAARRQLHEQQLKALTEEQQKSLEQIEAERQRREELKQLEQKTAETQKPANQEAPLTQGVPRARNEEIDAAAAAQAAQNVAEAKKAANEQIRLEAAKTPKKEAEKATDSFMQETPSTKIEQQSPQRTTVMVTVQNIKNRLKIYCNASNKDKKSCKFQKLINDTLNVFTVGDYESWKFSNELEFKNATLHIPNGDEYNSACFIYFAKIEQSGTDDTKITKILARVVGGSDNKVYNFDITSENNNLAIPVSEDCLKNKNIYLIAYNPPETEVNKPITSKSRPNQGPNKQLPQPSSVMTTKEATEKVAANLQRLQKIGSRTQNPEIVIRLSELNSKTILSGYNNTKSGTNRKVANLTTDGNTETELSNLHTISKDEFAKVELPNPTTYYTDITNNDFVIYFAKDTNNNIIARKYDDNEIKSFSNKKKITYERPAGFSGNLYLLAYTLPKTQKVWNNTAVNMRGKRQGNNPNTLMLPQNFSMHGMRGENMGLKTGGSATIKTQKRWKMKPGTLKRSTTMKTRKHRYPKKAGIRPATVKRI